MELTCLLPVSCTVWWWWWWWGCCTRWKETNIFNLFWKMDRWASNKRSSSSLTIKVFILPTCRVGGVRDRAGQWLVRSWTQWGAVWSWLLNVDGSVMSKIFDTRRQERLEKERKAGNLLWMILWKLFKMTTDTCGLQFQYLLVSPECSVLQMELLTHLKWPLTHSQIDQ